MFGMLDQCLSFFFGAKKKRTMNLLTTDLTPLQSRISRIHVIETLVIIQSRPNNLYSSSFHNFIYKIKA